jgi:hypothetical protein
MDTVYECPPESIPPYGVCRNLSGTNITEYFVSYFTHPQGSVPWQYEKV